MIITIFNLATGETRDYSCPANEAVVCAYEQERKNWSTWQYDYSKAVISKSKKTISCGNWAAILT